MARHAEQMPHIDITFFVDISVLCELFQIQFATTDGLPSRTAR
jgi:hypothetical protein